MTHKYRRIYAENVSVYLGKNAGDHIIKQIQNAQKSIKVISPYLSVALIDLLIAKANQGVEVLLLTNDDRSSRFDPTGQGQVIRRLLTQQQFVDEAAYQEKTKKIRTYQVCMILSIILIFVCLFAMPTFKAKISFAILFTIAASIFRGKLKAAKRLPVFYYQYFASLNFKIIKQRSARDDFFHVKAYVIDGETAYFGSLNFTQSGFHRNIESCITVKDNAAQAIDTYLQELFYSNEVAFYTEQEIVQTYFYEPLY